MKFYILKEETLTFRQWEEDSDDEDSDEDENVVRHCKKQITKIHPMETGPDVGKQICKKMEEKLNPPPAPVASNDEDSADTPEVSANKRPRLEVDPPPVAGPGQASIHLDLFYGHDVNDPPNGHVTVTGTIIGLLSHFKNILQVDPDKIRASIRGELFYGEQIPEGTSPIPAVKTLFGSVRTIVKGLVPPEAGDEEDSYVFHFWAPLKIASSKNTDVSSSNEESPLKELWNNVDLPFIASFTMKLTIDEINEDSFTDKKIGDNMSVNKKLLTEAVGCDLKIVVDNGAVIPCHKGFLQAQSTVFVSMFNGKFKEAKTNEVPLPGKTEEAIRALLAYLYYWDISVPFIEPKIAVQLYKIAHEYDIKQLQTCMMEILEKRNAEEWLDTTDMALSLLPYVGSLPDTNVLKNAVVRFFIKNGKELRESEPIREIFKKTPNVALDLFAEVCVWKKKDVE